MYGKTANQIPADTGELGQTFFALIPFIIVINVCSLLRSFFLFFSFFVFFVLRLHSLQQIEPNLKVSSKGDVSGL